MTFRKVVGHITGLTLVISFFGLYGFVRFNNDSGGGCLSRIPKVANEVVFVNYKRIGIKFEKALRADPDTYVRVSKHLDVGLKLLETGINFQQGIAFYSVPFDKSKLWCANWEIADSVQFIAALKEGNFRKIGGNLWMSEIISANIKIYLHVNQGIASAVLTSNHILDMDLAELGDFFRNLSGPFLDQKSVVQIIDRCSSNDIVLCRLNSGYNSRNVTPISIVDFEKQFIKFSTINSSTESSGHDWNGQGIIASLSIDEMKDHSGSFSVVVRSTSGLANLGVMGVPNVRINIEGLESVQQLEEVDFEKYENQIYVLSKSRFESLLQKSIPIGWQMFNDAGLWEILGQQSFLAANRPNGLVVSNSIDEIKKNGEQPVTRGPSTFYFSLDELKRQMPLVRLVVGDLQLKHVDLAMISSSVNGEIRFVDGGIHQNSLLELIILGTQIYELSHSISI